MKKFLLFILFCGLLPQLCAQILIEDSSGRILSCRKIKVGRDNSIYFQLPSTGELYHRLPQEKCRKITLPKPSGIQDCDALYSAGKFQAALEGFRREGARDLYPTFYAYCLLYEALCLEKLELTRDAIARLRQKIPLLHEREKKTSSYGELLFLFARLLKKEGEKEEALAVLKEGQKYAWGSNLARMFFLRGELLEELKRYDESILTCFQLVLFFPDDPLHTRALEKLYRLLSDRKDPRAEKFGEILRQKKERNASKE